MSNLTNPIPLEALESDIGIVGRKGRGKSYTAKGCIVEPLLEMGRRVIVLDPLGHWWGLKATADGGPGFPIAVIGGPHADVPLDHHRGRELGEFLAAADMSVVIDMGALHRGEMIDFATELLEALYTKNRRPLWLVLEEADIFAPQVPATPATKVMHDEVDRIARRGRAFGFRLVTMTQRPARISKDVLTQLSTLVALGITGPHDRDAVKTWIEGNADRNETKVVTDSLADLKVGEGWVWAPDQGVLERVKFPPIKTLDTSKTPKAGDKAVEVKELARGDVEALREALRPPSAPTTPEKPAAAAQALSVAEKSEIWNKAWAGGKEDGYREGFEAGHEQGLLNAFGHLAIETPIMLQRIRDKMLDGKQVKTVEMAVDTRLNTAHLTAPPAVTIKTPPTAGKLSKATRDIIAFYQAIYPRAVPFLQAAKQAGVGMRSSQFKTYEPELIASGQVEAVGDRYRALSASGSPTEYLDKVRAQLSPAHARIFDYLRVSSRAGVSVIKEDIAAACHISPTSSTTSAALSLLLNEAEVIERDGDGWRLAEAFR